MGFLIIESASCHFLKQQEIKGNTNRGIQQQVVPCVGPSTKKIETHLFIANCLKVSILP